MINVRQKGAEGERQIAKELNAALVSVLAAQQWPDEVIKACETSVQRNQNQSAVGGSDLTNTFGLAIEIKRQEELSVSTWWKQCTTAALKNKEFPVLIYRQNNRPWHVVMYGTLPLPTGETTAVAYARVTIEWSDFISWFKQWVRRKLMNGDYPRV